MLIIVTLNGLQQAAQHESNLCLRWCSSVSTTLKRAKAAQSCNMRLLICCWKLRVFDSCLGSYNSWDHGKKTRVNWRNERILILIVQYLNDTINYKESSLQHTKIYMSKTRINVRLPRFVRYLHFCNAL